MSRRGWQCHSERSEESGFVARGGKIPRRCAPRNDTYGGAPVVAWVIALVVAPLAALLGAPCAFAQTEPKELKPDWDRAFEQGIEWCAPVGAEPATGLLLCTKYARIDLIDLKTGRSRLAEAIPVQPGTQFAGAPGDVAYGYGVSQVYAFQVECSGETNNARPGLRWHVAAAPQECAEGDPEFMTRIVAGQATPRGVLIVRSDGRIAELLREDGSVRWRDELPDMPNCKLLVRDVAATIVWKSGEALHVAFFDLSSARLRPCLTKFEQPPPIWSSLTSDGLVAVWQKRFAVISPDGKTIFVEMHLRVLATTAGVAVFESAAQSSGEHCASVLLLAPSIDGAVCAYDFASREWDCPKRDSAVPAACFRPLFSMWVRSDRLFRASRGSLTVYDAARREKLAVLRHGNWAIDGATHEGIAYGLFSEFQSPRDLERLVEQTHDERIRGWLNKRVAPPDDAWPIRLIRQVIAVEPRPQASESPALEPRHFLLGSATPVLDTFWLGDTLVIVEGERVRAYTLP